MKRKINNVYSEMPKRELCFQKGISKPVNWFSHSAKVLFFISGLGFSTSAFGIVCTDIDTSFSEEDNNKYIARAPNDPVRYYMVGLSYYCGGNKTKGINYMKKASDMEHIVASYALGWYYRTDRGSDPSQIIPQVQENYDATVFYYERGASYIEAEANYPYNTHTDVPELEGKTYMSVSTFITLNELYYKGYVRAIMDMLKNDVAYTDTIKVIVNMQSAAERCLKRPSLSVWGEKQSEIAHSKQIKCGAYKTFADRAFYLESQRIKVAKRCDVPLRECDEHENIVSQLIQASKEMGSQIRSVPPI